MNIEEIGLTVMLLASQARLLELFRSLEAQGMLQLQIASSINDAERLLTENPPDFAFIQSRISALSSEIMVRHVRLLAKDSKIVLLSGDEEELKRAPSLQALAINLGGSDESLRYAVRELLVTAEGAPAPPAAEEAASEASASVVSEQPTVSPEEPQPEVPKPEVPKPEVPKPEIPRPEVPKPEVQAQRSFEQTLRAQQLHEEQMVTHREGEHQPAPEAPPKAQKKKRRSVVTAPAQSLRDFASKSYLSRRRVHRRAALAIGGLLVCAAAGGYLLFAGHTHTASQSHFFPIPPRPAAPTQPAAPLHPAPAPAPVPKDTAPKPNEGMVPEAPPAPSKSGKGLRDLPPFVVDAEQDAEYGKTHPGWERYVTPRMEYKIFREGTLIKAVQIMAARDETVPAEIFNWARKEFAGKAPYRLETKEKKGSYQVEKWQTDAAGLTVYRKEPELKMRALVLYYR